MDLTRCLLVTVLVLGLLQAGLAKPSTKPADKNAQAVESDDYSNDDDYNDNDDYNDEPGAENSDRSSEKKPSTKLESNNVLSNPYFKQAEYTATVKAGDTAMLECKPQNLGSSSLIMWYNNHTLLYQQQNRLTPDQRISLDDQYTLRISDVTASDQGLYRCVVLPTNEEQHARLEVQTRPVVNIYGGDGRDVTENSVTLVQGESFELECRGSGRPEPQIKWSAEGQRLVSGRGIHVDGGRLTILAADHDHVRNYQCLADNGVLVGHAGVAINVQYTPIVRTNRRIINTIVGDDAELHCNYTSSGEAQVVWRRKNGIIDTNDSAKYKVHNRGGGHSDGYHRSTLLVRNVQSADLGQYNCTVHNDLGAGQAHVHLVLVPEPPRFVSADVNEQRVVTHWRVHSHQALNEIALSYMKNGSTTWLSGPLHHEKSKEHSGKWKIQHELNLAPGVWHARVKAKNTEGWSEYSDQATIVVQPAFDMFGSEQYIDDVVTQTLSAASSFYSVSQLIAMLSLGVFLAPVLRRV